MSNEIAERFWAKVQQGDSCWTWIGATSRPLHRPPRGFFSINRKSRQAHRVAWELTNGEIPTGICVCHHCDNPICVRPDHLFLGTQRDNIHDMLKKGRMARVTKGRRGQFLSGNRSAAKLNEHLVREIVSSLRDGASGRALARKYGVTPHTVRQIRHGRSWSTVTGLSENTDG